MNEITKFQSLFFQKNSNFEMYLEIIIFLKKLIFFLPVNFLFSLITFSEIILYFLEKSKQLFIFNVSILEMKSSKHNKMIIYTFKFSKN